MTYLKQLTVTGRGYGGHGPTFNSRRWGHIVSWHIYVKENNENNLLIQSLIGSVEFSHFWMSVVSQNYFKRFVVAFFKSDFGFRKSHGVWIRYASICDLDALFDYLDPTFHAILEQS